jgi:hypothetical protein
MKSLRSPTTNGVNGHPTWNSRIPSASASIAWYGSAFLIGACDLAGSRDARLLRPGGHLWPDHDERTREMVDEVFAGVEAAYTTRSS